MRYRDIWVHCNELKMKMDAAMLLREGSYPGMVAMGALVPGKEVEEGNMARAENEAKRCWLCFDSTVHWLHLPRSGGPSWTLAVDFGDRIDARGSRVCRRSQIPARRQSGKWTACTWWPSGLAKSSLPGSSPNACSGWILSAAKVGGLGLIRMEVEGNLPAVGYLVSLFVDSYLRLAQEQIVKFSCADMLQCSCHGTWYSPFPYLLWNNNRNTQHIRLT